MEEICISIIVPVYNVEKYLKKCLDSIVTQNFKNIEIICIDDNSPDESGEILFEYQKKDKRISIIKNPENKGLSYSRNVGLNVARGKYILFVDSDDYLIKGALNLLYNRSENDNLDILYFNKTYFFDDEWSGNFNTPTEKNFGENEIITGREMFTRFCLNDSYKSMNAYTQFFRRDFLLKNNLKFIEGLVHEDYTFYFFCAMKAERVGNLDKALYRYCRRNSSITEVMTPLRKQSLFYTLIKIVQYWRSNKFLKRENEAISRFLSLIYHNCIQSREKIFFIDKLCFGSYIDKFLYSKLMCSEFVEFYQDELDEMKKCGGVWIYGTGRVAREVVNIFETQKIKILGFIVTKKNNMETFFGWKVWELGKAPLDVTGKIVVAAAGKFKEEIKTTLLHLGYSNLIFASK